MRVLVFCYEFPPVGGGAGHALSHLGREWVKLGHEITVLTSGFEDLQAEETVSGMRIIRLGVGRKLIHKAGVFEMFRYMIRSAFYALVHYKNLKPDRSIAFMTIPGGLGPLLLRKMHGVPFVAEIRGGDVPGFDPVRLRFYHALTKSFILTVWKNASSVIATCRGVARLAEKSLNGLKVKISANGVDLVTFHPGGNHRSGAKLSLLFVGRFAETQKNVATILRALSGMDGVELRAVGEGPDRPHLEAMIREYKMENRVQMPGWLQGNELVEAFQNAHVYVSASRWEGIPNAVVQAMACGLPLVLSDVAGHEDCAVEGMNGFLFKADDADQLKRCISRFQNDPQLQFRMGHESRRIAQERHHWGTLAREHLKIVL